MSEFGSGYAVCLRQFVNHRARLSEDDSVYGALLRFSGEEMAISLWMNAASDHLYGLTQPAAVVGEEEWGRASVLADRAIHIGHGFGPHSRSTRAECVRLLDEAERLLGLLEMPTSTLAECLSVDRDVLGIDADAGAHTCPWDVGYFNEAAAAISAAAHV